MGCQGQFIVEISTWGGAAVGIPLLNIKKQRGSDFRPGQTHLTANCLRKVRPSFCGLGLPWPKIPRLFWFSKGIPTVASSVKLKGELKGEGLVNMGIT